jgi:hypothetical protein
MLLGGALVLAASSSDGDVAERAALGPVAAARLAEVARLREAVIVVVAELGVRGLAPRALERLIVLRAQPPVRCRRRGRVHLPRVRDQLRRRRRRPHAGLLGDDALKAKHKHHHVVAV